MSWIRLSCLTLHPRGHIKKKKNSYSIHKCKVKHLRIRTTEDFKVMKATTQKTLEGIKASE